MKERRHMKSHKWLMGLVLLNTILAGCSGGGGSGDELAAAGNIYGARGGTGAGKVTIANPVPVSLESRWTTRELWTMSAGSGYARIKMNDLGPGADQVPGEFMVTGPDSHVVFSLQSAAVDASKCGGIQAHCPKSHVVGFWWARDTDIKKDVYPFSRDRYVLMTEIESGLFETDPSVTENPNWAGAIRLVRLDLYATPGDPVSLQSVSFKISKSSSLVGAGSEIPQEYPLDEPGRISTYLMRARAMDRLEDWQAVAWALNRAKTPDEADRKEAHEQAMLLGVKALQENAAPVALQAFSAGAVASGNPVSALYDLYDQLKEPERAVLWPDGNVSLVVESFEDYYATPFYPWRDSGKRPVTKNELVKDVALDGTQSCHLLLGEPAAEGVSWFVATLNIPLTDKPFVLRFYVRQMLESKTQGVVLAALPDDSVSVFTDSIPMGADKDGWKCYELAKPLVLGASGFDKKEYTAGTRLRHIGLNVEGRANEYWVDRVELAFSPKP